MKLTRLAKIRIHLQAIKLTLITVPSIVPMCYRVIKNVFYKTFENWDGESDPSIDVLGSIVAEINCIANEDLPPDAEFHLTATYQDHVS